MENEKGYMKFEWTKKNKNGIEVWTNSSDIKHLKQDEVLGRLFLKMLEVANLNAGEDGK